MKSTIKTVLSLLSAFLVLTGTGMAYAQESSDMLAAAKISSSSWIAIAAGLCLGLAAFGGALGQGRAASSALDGIARNPGARDSVFTPFILALALIESLVIYALIIAILLFTKMA